MTTPPNPQNHRARLDEALVTLSTGLRAAEEARIREQLLTVAKPDSRYQLNLDFFIPDFVGSAAAAELLTRTPEYRRASRIFVTPDNALIEIRQRCLADGKIMVLPSYGLTQGFLRVDPATIAPAAFGYAAWLDGIQHFAQPITLSELCDGGDLDMVIAGAAAVTEAGVRFGMGHRYLDIEWGLLSGVGLLRPSTPVATMVHDVQLSRIELPTEPIDITADIIALPGSTLRAVARSRVAQLDEAMLSPELAATPVVNEYRQMTRRM